MKGQRSFEGLSETLRGVSGAAAMVEKDESSPGGISEEEAAQYDRQIRLWGLEAQKRSVGLGMFWGGT